MFFLKLSIQQETLGWSCIWGVYHWVLLLLNCQTPYFPWASQSNNRNLDGPIFFSSFFRSVGCHRRFSKFRPDQTRRVSQDFLKTSQHLLRTFSWLSLDFLIAFSRLSPRYPRTFPGLSQEFFNLFQEFPWTFQQLYQDFLRAFSGLSQQFFRTFSWLSPDFLRTFQGHSFDFLRTF